MGCCQVSNNVCRGKQWAYVTVSRWTVGVSKREFMYICSFQKGLSKIRDSNQPQKLIREWNALFKITPLLSSSLEATTQWGRSSFMLLSSLRAEQWSTMFQSHTHKLLTNMMLSHRWQTRRKTTKAWQQRVFTSACRNTLKWVITKERWTYNTGHLEDN